MIAHKFIITAKNLNLKSFGGGVYWHTLSEFNEQETTARAAVLAKCLHKHWLAHVICFICLAPAVISVLSWFKARWLSELLFSYRLVCFFWAFGSGVLTSVFCDLFLDLPRAYRHRYLFQFKKTWVKDVKYITVRKALLLWMSWENSHPGHNEWIVIELR